jgi:hypothetical protein
VKTQKTREDAEDPLNVQIGYLKSLLADHQGERHVLTVGQHAAGRARPGRYAVCLVKAAWREEGVEQAHEQTGTP